MLIFLSKPPKTWEHMHIWKKLSSVKLQSHHGGWALHRDPVWWGSAETSQTKANNLNEMWWKLCMGHKRGWKDVQKWAHIYGLYVLTFMYLLLVHRCPSRGGIWSRRGRSPGSGGRGGWHQRDSVCLWDCDSINDPGGGPWPYPFERVPPRDR